MPRKSKLKPVQDKMVKAIQDVAKENGYAHVLYKEYALVFPEADDLADRVKKNWVSNKRRFSNNFYN